MSNDKLPNRMSRRTFLKMSATTVAAVTAGDLFFNGADDVFQKTAIGAEPEAQQAYGVCRMCQQQYCSLKATLKDGVVTRLEGVPESLLSNGTLCARGNSAIAQHYNPYRVKTPLMRTNPQKGLDVDPGWKEISWDEALQIIGDRLRKIREEDPRRFAYNQGFSRTGILISDTNYVKAFGSPNDFRSNGSLCATHFVPASTVGTFLGPNYDFAYTNYCLVLGRNMGPSTGVSGGGSRGDGGIATKYFMYAMDRGMKVVSVNPHLQPEASHPNGRWLPLQPVSELAFVLALTHVLLHELKVYDEEFVTWRTNLPYLIRPNGSYAKDEGDKPLLWDLADNKAKAFDDPTLTKPALTGTFAVGAEEVKPAFVYLLESVADTTPEKVASETGTSAEEIRKIAKELVEHAQIGATIKIDNVTFPLRPAAVIAGRGVVAQKNGILCHMAVVNINMLLGAVGVPGGVHPDLWGPFFEPDKKDGLVKLVSEAVPWWSTEGNKYTYPPQRVDLKEFYPVSHHMPHLAFKVIADPKKYGLTYTLDTLLIYGGNSIQHNAAPEEVLKAMATIPFVFSISYHLDEPAWMSDIVLPEDSNLERYIVGRAYKDIGLRDGKPLAYQQTNIQRPVVSRLYDTKQPDDIFIDIAEKVGFLYGKGGVNDAVNKGFKPDFQVDINQKYYTKDLLDRQVKSDWGANHGIDEAEPFVQKTVPLSQRYAYSYHPGRTTRHRVYFEHLLETGLKLKESLKRDGQDTVPGWKPGEKFFEYYMPLPRLVEEENNNPPTGYPMRVVNWKTPQFLGLVGGNDNPWLQQVARDFDPYVFGICLNPDTADKLGIQTGDQVLVESKYGKCEGAAILTETIHPNCAGVAGNLGRRSPGLNPTALDGPNYNQLLTGDEGMIDPLAGQIPMTEWVRVTKI